jgi:hypothetical protein
MNNQIAPLPYKKIWQSALNIFKISFNQVWYIAFLFGLISSIPNAFMTLHKDAAVNFPLLLLAIVLVQIIIGVYFNGMILHRTYALSTDKSIKFADSLVHVWHRLMALILNSLLVSLIILVGVLLFVLLIDILRIPIVAVTVFLFAVPGVFFIVLQFFCLPLILLEKRGAFVAIKYSCVLVWHNWWRTFLVMMPIVVFNVLLSYLIGLLTKGNPWIMGIAQVIILTVFFPLFYALMLVQFNDLKARQTMAKPVVTA